MAIAVTCSGCDRTMKVRDDFAGQRALCPFCKAEVRVPSQERAGEERVRPRRRRAAAPGRSG